MDRGPSLTLRARVERQSPTDRGPQLRVLNEVKDLVRPSSNGGAQWNEALRLRSGHGWNARAQRNEALRSRSGYGWGNTLTISGCPAAALPRAVVEMPPQPSPRAQ